MTFEQICILKSLTVELTALFYCLFPSHTRVHCMKATTFKLLFLLLCPHHV